MGDLVLQMQRELLLFRREKTRQLEARVAMARQREQDDLLALCKELKVVLRTTDLKRAAPSSFREHERKPLALLKKTRLDLDGKAGVLANPAPPATEEERQPQQEQKETLDENQNQNLHESVKKQLQTAVVEQTDRTEKVEEVSGPQELAAANANQKSADHSSEEATPAAPAIKLKAKAKPRAASSSSSSRLQIEALDKLRVIDLHQELKKRGIKIGRLRKAQLIARLRQEMELETIQEEEEEEEEQEHEQLVDKEEDLEEKPPASVGETSFQAEQVEDNQSEREKEIEEKTHQQVSGDVELTVTGLQQTSATVDYSTHLQSTLEKETSNQGPSASDSSTAQQGVEGPLSSVSSESETNAQNHVKDKDAKPGVAHSLLCDDIVRESDVMENQGCGIEQVPLVQSRASRESQSTQTMGSSVSPSNTNSYRTTEEFEVIDIDMSTPVKDPASITATKVSTEPMDSPGLQEDRKAPPSEPAGIIDLCSPTTPSIITIEASEEAKENYSTSDDHVKASTVRKDDVMEDVHEKKNVSDEFTGKHAEDCEADRACDETAATRVEDSEDIQSNDESIETKAKDLESKESSDALAASCLDPIPQSITTVSTGHLCEKNDVEMDDASEAQYNDEEDVEMKEPAPDLESSHHGKRNVQNQANANDNSKMEKSASNEKDESAVEQEVVETAHNTSEIVSESESEYVGESPVCKEKPRFVVPVIQNKISSKNSVVEVKTESSVAQNTNRPSIKSETSTTAAEAVSASVKFSPKSSKKPAPAELIRHESSEERRRREDMEEIDREAQRLRMQAKLSAKKRIEAAKASTLFWAKREQAKLHLDDESTAAVPAVLPRSESTVSSESSHSATSVRFADSLTSNASSDHADPNEVASSSHEIPHHHGVAPSTTAVDSQTATKTSTESAKPKGGDSIASVHLPAKSSSNPLSDSQTSLTSKASSSSIKVDVGSKATDSSSATQETTVQPGLTQHTDSSVDQQRSSRAASFRHPDESSSSQSAAADHATKPSASQPSIPSVAPVSSARKPANLVSGLHSLTSLLEKDQASSSTNHRSNGASSTRSAPVVSALKQAERIRLLEQKKQLEKAKRKEELVKKYETKRRLDEERIKQKLQEKEARMKRDQEARKKHHHQVASTANATSSHERKKTVAVAAAGNSVAKSSARPVQNQDSANYVISDNEESSDSDSDDDSGKNIPAWAQKENLKKTLDVQFGENAIDPTPAIFPDFVASCDLEAIFHTNDPKKKKKYAKRTSSANWMPDRPTARERAMYKREMGFTSMNRQSQFGKRTSTAHRSSTNGFASNR